MNFCFYASDGRLLAKLPFTISGPIMETGIADHFVIMDGDEKVGEGTVGTLPSADITMDSVYLQAGHTLELADMTLLERELPQER